ncbi:MAG: glycerophosphodiester phosphodiesterase family protein [Cyclobacteriaceae bacterium]
MIKIGHRGAMGYAPENTIRSFEVAIEMGAPVIELDVTRCATGEVVVIHDDRVDRTTNGDGYVYDFSLDQLKKLDAGDGEQIPTLKEAMLALAGKCQLNIELKNRSVASEVARLIDEEVTAGRWSKTDLLISSFDHEALKAFQELQPALRIGVLIGIIPLNLRNIIGDLKAYSVNPCLDFINNKLIADAREQGLKVFVWTVNHPEDIARMKKMEVDGIFTNYPDRL